MWTGYARRRAPVACAFCRHRKRRCDGGSPSCSLCASSGVECRYPPTHPLDSQNSKQQQPMTNEALLKRLDELENMVRSKKSPTAQPQENGASSPQLQNQDTDQNENGDTEMDLVEMVSEGPSVSQDARQPSPGFQENNSEQRPTPASPDNAMLETQINGDHHNVTSPSVHNRRDSHNAEPDADTANIAMFPSMVPTPEDMVPLFQSNWGTEPFLPVVHPQMHPEEMQQPSMGSNTISSDRDTGITIPAGHLTITGSLFTLQGIKRMVGDYPADFFYQTESAHEFQVSSAMGRDLNLSLATLELGRDVTDRLVANFFSHVHPYCPILDQDSFSAFMEQSIRGNSRNSADAALCLVVLALGSLFDTATSITSPSVGERESTAAAYFEPAYQILTSGWVSSLGTTLSLPSGLVLCAIYFDHNVKPLASWKMIYMASSTLQLIACQPKSGRFGKREDDIISRLCWVCFILESDTLADFHVPHSGIEAAIDRIHFPRFGNHSDRDGLMFLAQCSIRRLLNRIHNAVYASATKQVPSPSSPSSIAASETDQQDSAFAVIAPLEGILKELSRQLDTWYYSLPDIIKPDLTSNVSVDTHDAWLRLRYWSARHIITRPCLIYATTSIRSRREMPAFVYEYSKVCVESCRNYVQTAIHVLSSTNQYIWMTIQATFAASMVLSIAATSSLFHHLVPDIGTLLRDTAKCIEPWSTPDSTAEAVVWILRTLYHKTRLFKMDQK